MSRKVLLMICLIGFATTVGASVREEFTPGLFQHSMELSNINQLNLDRIVFHSFNMLDNDDQWISGADYQRDNSQATLLVITDERVYLLKDGYEPPELLTERKRTYWNRQQDWEQETRMILYLSERQREVERLRRYLAPTHPSIIRLQNDIISHMRHHDPILRTEYGNLVRARGYLGQLERQYGTYSAEYARQRDLIKELEEKVQVREALIRNVVRRKLTEDQNQAAGTATPAADASSGSEPEEMQLSERPPLFKDYNFYVNRLDGAPDYLMIANARLRTVNVENIDMPEEEAWVSTNFTEFYKRLRDRHIRRFVSQYTDLLSEPEQFNARIFRNRAILSYAREGGESHTTAPGSAEQGAATDAAAPSESGGEDVLWYRRVDIIANDGTHYTAIDADGDRITETFLVSEAGGFNWGRPELPNVIAIYNNREPEVQELIKSLVEIAFRGTEEKLTEYTGDASRSGDLESWIETEEQLSRQSYPSPAEEAESLGQETTPDH